ncbi:MAG TPA: cytochrome C [Bacteroidota bacterium]|nr:cytochrome C [Bacteroidota bacterium]
MFWSFSLDAPLEEPANPTLTPNPSKAPWYFLGLQEMLVYFDPWVAGVVLPTFVIIGLMAIPYIDVNEKGNGYYTFKERKYAVLIYCFGFLILWVSLIVLGTFWRGPGWYFFFPWQEWDTHRVVALTNVDLSEYFGIHTRHADNSLNPWAIVFGVLLIGGYYSLMGIYWMIKKNSELVKKMGFTKYSITAFLFLTMMSLPIKMFLRIAFNVKYILVTPWFNI